MLSPAEAAAPEAEMVTSSPSLSAPRPWQGRNSGLCSLVPTGPPSPHPGRRLASRSSSRLTMSRARGRAVLESR